ncbi:rRNA maturation RNase YbeY [Candidatus Kaiserbacteria bacterium RIFCSPHIGHO2_01_FULL_56_24]|uniref:Endoribonuclease YbeY n=1 Tax=Candidatus Kaiserbacteria bacterium RIFCSPHIGHO2_01_FULL_56_24 TaxID=1798487 RepID=A0A1F6DIK0_9BACT|nr:MAG: rRNA maturation RNase YbeY [Candidatus Kaiserbacteria bacterium RIFCSPHIGHO2_01_FULL_56_24]
MKRRPIVEIRRTVQNAVRLPFEDIAKAVLPKGYQLSLVVCGDTLAQRMNKEYRKKTYKPNVLSFPLSKNEGEIFLNVRKAEREARAMGISARSRIAHLFVHGCAHLKGLDHSDRMDALEQKVLEKFKLQ